jgi:hypothetical protein
VGARLQHVRCARFACRSGALPRLHHSGAFDVAPQLRANRFLPLVPQFVENPGVMIT